jgi:uncharacterized protein
VRRDVEIDAGDARLRGWLYLPDDGDGPFPAVVLAHGFSALKEMGLDRYAEVFAAAGLAAIVYDHRNFGASDGEPRGEIDWIVQMRDYRRVVTWAGERVEIDAERIGVWGTSYSGGLVLIVAATDRRVKCVVSQVPFVSGIETMHRVMPPEARAAFFETIDRERRSLAAGNPPSYVPICVDDPEKPPEAPGRRTFRYFDGYRRTLGVPWENRVTIRSLEWRLEYEALPFAAHVAPTPLLVIVAEDDDVTPPEIALDAYARAGEPKKLVRIPGHHYRPYVEAFDESSTVARDWFVEHLRPEARARRSGHP